MQTPVNPGRPHEEAVVERFRKRPDYALHLLNHCLEEGDQAFFLSTLRRLARAFGGIQQVAQQANINETAIYRILSAEGNPQLGNVIAILGALGLRLAVTPAAEGVFGASLAGDGGAEEKEVPAEAEVASV